MDFTRNSSRMHCYRFLAVALALTINLFGQGPQWNHTVSNYPFKTLRPITISNGTSVIMRVTYGTQIFNINPGGIYPITIQTNHAVQGLTAQNPTVTSDGMVSTANLTWHRSGYTSELAGAGSIAGFGYTGTAKYQAAPYVVDHTFPNASYTINADGTGSLTSDAAYDQYTAPLDPDAGKTFTPGVMMLENNTGAVQEMQFGDEVIELQPGMNAVPFFGEVDSNGFPKAFPLDGNFRAAQGPDGTPYFYGALNRPSGGGAPVWEATPQGFVEVYGSPGGDGYTVKTPGKNGGSPVYTQLPKGMTAGNIAPLPGGLSAGTAGLPSGMTPGVNGALPKGVASGGTAKLPQGMSPGTAANPFPTGGIIGGATGGTAGGAGSGLVAALPSTGIRPPGTRTTDPPVTGGGGTGGTGGGGTGGGGTGGGGTGDGTGVPPKIAGGGVNTTVMPTDASGGYQAGSGMNGLDGEAKAMGEGAAQRVGESMTGGLGAIGASASGVLGSTGGTFWTVPNPGAFDGVDRSWQNLQLTLGTKVVNIVIPEQWLTLLRAIMLWIIRVVFVMACIRLVMS